MICSRCLRHASSARMRASNCIDTFTASTASSSQRRVLSTTLTKQSTPIFSSTAPQTNPSRNPPAATSTSAAQPFSTPLTPSPAATGTPTKPSKPSSHKTVKSSCLAGTPLRNLNYFKNKEDPIAMEDHEYPDWLWTVLGDGGKGRKAGDQGDGKASGASKMELDAMLYSKSAAARRVANKRLRKQAAAEAGSLEAKTPIYAQTIDLPLPVDGSPAAVVEAAEARSELNRAMRQKRRHDIKEKNFLTGMR